MGDATPEEMDKMMETVGEIQTELEHGGFYSLDSKIEETANGLGLGSIGLDRDVAELSGGQRSKVLFNQTSFAKFFHSAFGRTYQLS